MEERIDNIKNKHQDNIFGRIIVMDSCWSVLFLILLVLIGYRNMHIGLIFLFVIALLHIIHLDNEVNHNENIEMLE